MKQFNGPKFQQGKMGGDPDYNHPESKSFARELVRDATVTKVELDEDDVLYIQVRSHRDFPPHVEQKIAENVRNEFKSATGDTPVVVGFHDLRFTVISKKKAFTEKIAGRVK